MIDEKFNNFSYMSWVRNCHESLPQKTLKIPQIGNRRLFGALSASTRPCLDAGLWWPSTATTMLGTTARGGTIGSKAKCWVHPWPVCAGPPQSRSYHKHLLESGLRGLPGSASRVRNGSSPSPCAWLARCANKNGTRTRWLGSEPMAPRSTASWSRVFKFGSIRLKNFRSA